MACQYGMENLNCEFKLGRHTHILIIPIDLIARKLNDYNSLNST